MTTSKNEAKRLAKAMYIKGLIPSADQLPTVETMIEETLVHYAGIILNDERKKLKQEGN